MTTLSTRDEAVGGIAANRLSVRLGSQLVLDKLTFSIPAGTSAAVIGPNGSGKTTLLNTVVGLIRPEQGTVTIGPSGAATVAYVLQHRDNRRWLPLTAGEVVTMGRYPKRGFIGRLRSDDRDAIGRAAARMEVDSLLTRQFAELSGGQRQRVMLAQALAQEPSVLLLDEPITGLDLASQQRILELIDAETTAGTTVMITTHHLDEARHCTTVLLLASRLIASGSPDQVLQPAHLRAAFGDRLLGDHQGHDHSADLLMVDDHGHGHSHDHDAPPTPSGRD